MDNNNNTSIQRLWDSYVTYKTIAYNAYTTTTDKKRSYRDWLVYWPLTLYVMFTLIALYLLT